MVHVACSQCGGPLTLGMVGQSFTVTTTLTTDGDGRASEVEETVKVEGWCATCIREWEERLT